MRGSSQRGAKTASQRSQDKKERQRAREGVRREVQARRDKLKALQLELQTAALAQHDPRLKQQSRGCKQHEERGEWRSAAEKNNNHSVSVDPRMSRHCVNCRWKIDLMWISCCRFGPKERFLQWWSPRSDKAIWNFSVSKQYKVYCKSVLLRDDSYVSVLKKCNTGSGTHPETHDSSRNNGAILYSTWREIPRISWTCMSSSPRFTKYLWTSKFWFTAVWQC